MNELREKIEKIKAAIDKPMDAPKDYELNVARVKEILEDIASDPGAAASKLDESVTKTGTFSLREWAVWFLSSFLSKVRDTVCSSKFEETGSKAGLTSKALVTGMASWISGLAGFSGPLPTAAAALIIFVLATSARDSFCEMTDAEVLAKIANSSRR